jgi:hypothetical protein
MATTIPQDPYSSADIAAGDYAADQAFSATRATALRDWDRLQFTKPIHLHLAEDTTTSATDVTLQDFYLTFPEWSSSLDLLFTLESYVSGGTGTWYVTDQGGTDTSDEIEVAVTGGYGTDSGPATLAVHEDWVGERVHILMKGRVTGGNTLYLRNLSRMTLKFTD